jgi:hypothetical protein
MKKILSRFPNRNRPLERTWHNGGDIEVRLYARSLQSAAKMLVQQLERQPQSSNWDAASLIPLYRLSVELFLKLLVGEGSNFLRVQTDPITLSTTHSVRWLAQIVCQIIKAVKWENEFKCEGIATLAEFSAVIAELERCEPVSLVTSSPQDRALAPRLLQPSRVIELTKKLDSVIDLLDMTADGLAAEWDRFKALMAAKEALWRKDGSEPTIQ